jgi:hypothetical protein
MSILRLHGIDQPAEVLILRRQCSALGPLLQHTPALGAFTEAFVSIEVSLPCLRADIPLVLGVRPIPKSSQPHRRALLDVRQVRMPLIRSLLLGLVDFDPFAQCFQLSLLLGMHGMIAENAGRKQNHHCYSYH